MKNFRREAFLWVQLGGFVSVWVILLYVTGTGLVINWEAVKKIPDAVTVYVILAFVFTKWMWRWRVFRGWLIPYPDLEGTWRGKITSTWKNVAGERLAPIPVVLVIRQTFSSVSCTVFTQESESFSTAAQMTVDEESGTIHLSYNYTNRPKATIRERSAIHDGAARLRVVGGPQLRLRGEFWTSRCTAGDVDVQFEGRSLAEAFSAK
jgi:hypothetical protein